jgi:hypothetical protein
MKKTLFMMFALLMMGMAVKAQDAIQLPQPEVQKLSMTLGDALKQRRSYRDMSEQEVDLQTVSTILWAACGISDPATGKITAPSAVNMQDIKVFVCSQYGVCRYMPKENTLVPVTMTEASSPGARPSSMYSPSVSGVPSYTFSAPAVVTVRVRRVISRVPRDSVMV